jgi:hypothetical protein
MRVSGGVSAGLGLVVAVCLGTGLLVVGGVAGADEPPAADAGLDQAVERNATVYLDAGGSYHPDGEVAGYNWAVVAPNGTEFEPDCVTCERTSFRAAQTGQYNVTVTVAGGTGMRTSDTVYVTVEEPDPPELQLTGPESLFVGGDGTASADVTAGDEPLSRLAWSVDGSEVETEELTGSGTRERTLSFGAVGTHTLTAAVTDVLGRTTTDTHTVEVVETSPSSGSSAPPTAGGGGGDSPDASTDFVVANSDGIRGYSDLSFNNYADGDSAITLDNTAGPGEITLVGEEEAEDYLESYNWHNVNLGELVRDDLVDESRARQIVKRARENRYEHGNGAVGGINPYETDEIEEPPNPLGGEDSLTPPPDGPTSTTDTTTGTDLTGPPSSETVTITPGRDTTSSGLGESSDSAESETDSPAAESAPESNSGGDATATPRHGPDTVTII